MLSSSHPSPEKGKRSIMPPNQINHALYYMLFTLSRARFTDAWSWISQRKLDEQRAKALEKTQNDIAKARRKAEDKRASAEAKRGLKLAKVLELANFMKAVGRVPTKRSFF